MEVLYVDSLFVLNLAIDYCVLLSAARVSGVVLRRWRYALGAALGAAYAVGMVLPGGTWLGQTPMKLTLGVLMSLAAFGGETRFWRCTAVFFAVSALFGGAVFSASLLAGAESLGGAFVSVSARVLILSFGVCYFVVARLFRRQTQRAARAVCEVRLTLGGQTVTLRALRDTGSALHDPVSGEAVLVADRSALNPLLPPGLPSDPTEALGMLASRSGKWRLLPCSTIGGETLLLCFRPDRVTIDGREGALRAAIAPAPVSPDGSYDALLPCD